MKCDGKVADVVAVDDLWLLQSVLLAVTRAFWAVQASAMDLSATADTTSAQAISAPVSI